MTHCHVHAHSPIYTHQKNKGERTRKIDKCFFGNKTLMLRGRELKLLYFFLDFLRNVSSVSLFQDILNHYVGEEKKCGGRPCLAAEMMKNLFCGVIETGSCSFYNIQGPI